ncbi:MAG: tetratricopeptide repeat protein [Aminipila sp.]
MDLNNFYSQLDTIFKNQDIHSAEKYIVEQMLVAQKDGDVAGILATANEIGGIYRVTSRFEDAKKSYEVALGAISLLGLENTEQHGTTVLNLATVYAANGKNKEALELYLKAEGIFNLKGLNNDYRMAALYNNISHVFEEENDYINAEINSEKALKIIEKIPGADVELATTYTTIANIYIKQNKLLEAERYLYTSEKIFQGLNGKVDVHYGATLNVFGELYFHMKDYIKSIDYFKKSLQLVIDNYGESNLSYVAVCKNIASVYEVIGQFSEKTKYENMAKLAEERIK